MRKLIALLLFFLVFLFTELPVNLISKENYNFKASAEEGFIFKFQEVPPYASQEEVNKREYTLIQKLEAVKKSSQDATEYASKLRQEEFNDNVLYIGMYKKDKPIEKLLRFQEMTDILSRDSYANLWSHTVRFNNGIGTLANGQKVIILMQDLNYSSADTVILYLKDTFYEEYEKNH